MTCWIVCVLFFFRQKTAYEMRISDWSSDVCSSDLSFTRVFPGRLAAPPLPAIQRQFQRGSHLNMTDTPPDRLCADPDSPFHDAAAMERGEIGRASCRARVCQSV